MAEPTVTATIGITADVRHPNLSIPGVRQNMNFLAQPEFTVRNLPTWRVEELREMGFAVKVEEEEVTVQVVTDRAPDEPPPAKPPKPPKNTPPPEKEST